MASKLTPGVVQERLREYVGEHYLLLTSVIKGVTVWIAADILIQAASDQPTMVPRLCFLAGSLGATLVSYVTWSRGVVMTNEKYNVFDAAFPLLMGLVEILLFMVLLPNKDLPDLLWYWYPLIGLHAFCA